MIAELNIGGQKIRAALDRGVSLAIAVDFANGGPRHFGAGAPSSMPYASGKFTGSVSTGASANCSTITLTPHCQMTHTESVAHLTRESGDACELVFFPRLRHELRTLLQTSPRLVRFRGLRGCVKHLAGARRWSPRCENLQDQIVGYLRECLSTESRETECRLLVE